MKFTHTRLIKPHLMSGHENLTISPIKIPSKFKNKIIIIKQEIGSFSKDSQNLISACIQKIHNKLIHSKLEEEGIVYIKELYSCFTERLELNNKYKTRDEIVLETKKLEKKIEEIGENINLLFRKTPDLEGLRSHLFSCAL